jgi:hypothetical protein
MKFNVSTLGVVLMLTVVTFSCNDRNAEKRIAELESRLKTLEGKKTVNPTPTGATPTISEPIKDEKPAGPLPVATFSTIEHDFGTINEGQVVEHTFSIKNTGEAPLIIQNAAPSCGCTVPAWTKEPIPPGGSGFVKAKFDSNGKPNMQNKSITVTANTYPKQTVLRFKAMVIPKTKEAPADGPVNR